MAEAHAVVLQNCLDDLGRAHRDGAFFDDDLRTVGRFGDGPRHGFDVTQIRCTIRADAVGLRGGVDADKNDFGFADRRAHLRAEEEVFASRVLHDFVQAGFIDGQVFRIPGGDALGVQVNDIHTNVRAF